MAETAARLERAAERISQARASGEPLPASPFTTQDKLRIAALGLDEKYIVRVTKTQYTGDDQGIGRPLASGKGAYWTTTFTQLEHADKDPELICQAVGVPYDPTSDYTLMVIDAEAAAAQGDQITMIPTYERLGALVKQELPDIDPADIDAVMTPEYSEEYLRLTERASSLGIRLTDSEDRREFAEQLGLDTNAKRALAVRSTIELEFGANPHFLGNGLTKNLDPRTSEEAPYGLLETFTFDRSPRTLGALAGSGALVKHPLARSSEATS